jgi:cold shock protein
VAPSGTLGDSSVSFDEESIVPEGIVRWFDPDRGFGFIARGDDAEDLFVHASEIVSDHSVKLLREGQVVEFEVGEGDRGPQARRVRVTGDRAADAPVGVLGTVAWYEPGKGYGFITPDGGGGEIFVHSTAIVGGGVISEGQRVAFLVVEGEKGPQADHLLPLGSDAAPQAVASDGADGTVSWYDADKGFGFVTPDSGGEDVFVHVRALAGGLSELSEGDRVTYDVAAS